MLNKLANYRHNEILDYRNRLSEYQIIRISNYRNIILSESQIIGISDYRKIRNMGTSEYQTFGTKAGGVRNFSLPLSERLAGKQAQLRRCFPGKRADCGAVRCGTVQKDASVPPPVEVGAGPRHSIYWGIVPCGMLS